jgi:hypothetical protein
MQIKIVLSEKPNSHLAGLLLGICRNWFSMESIDIQMEVCAINGIQSNPVMMVAEGKADIGVGNPRMLLSFLSQFPELPLKAVSAPAQKNFYHFTSIEGQQVSSINIKTGFAAKGTWGNIDELRYLMQGQSNDPEIDVIDDMGYESLQKGVAQIAYINRAWEGIMAEQHGINLTYHRETVHDLVMGYDPVYFIRTDGSSKKKALMKRFFAILNKGYHDAYLHPLQVAEELHRHFSGVYPGFEQLPFLKRSLMMIHTSILDGENRWGIMNEFIWEELVLALKRIDKYTKRDNSFMSRPELASHLFTNEYLPYS